jgi:predicted esterase
MMVRCPEKASGQAECAFFSIVTFVSFVFRKRIEVVPRSADFVLMMDEVCFVFGETMAENTEFRKLTQELVSLYNAGDYAAALKAVEQKVDSFPEERARTTFWRLCLLSLLGRPDDVMSLFRHGLDTDLWWADQTFIDPDLNAVRDLPEFKRLVEESHHKYLEARAHIQRDRAVLVPDKAGKELPLLIALHGRNGDKETNLERWDVARRRGWLVLSPQSMQPLYNGSYCWDDPAQGIKDILLHVDEMMRIYKVDRQRILFAGFSQGSGMAIYAALSGDIPARGFIGIGTFWRDPAQLDALAKQASNLRGYFITGEKDQTLDCVREIQNVLRANNMQFAEEVHADIGHEFSTDFASSFDRAIEFIFV